MAYTVIDILDKVIFTTEKKKKSCDEVLKDLDVNSSTHILLRVLTQNLGKSIKYYEKLKLEFKNSPEEEIDFVIYDKISFLINEFNHKVIVPENMDVKNILKCCLEFQNDELALYIDIQGRIVRNEKDVETNTYKILQSMILEKQRYIYTLTNFMKRYS